MKRIETEKDAVENETSEESAQHRVRPDEGERKRKHEINIGKVRREAMGEWRWSRGRERGREGGREGEGEREGRKERGREGEREGGREGEREGEREGGKEGKREGGREGGREGEREGEREGGKEGKREGGREGRYSLGQHDGLDGVNDDKDKEHRKEIELELLVSLASILAVERHALIEKRQPVKFRGALEPTGDGVG